MSILWDDVTIKPGTQSMRSENGTVVYDSGMIEGVLDQDDIVCPANDGLLDRFEALLYDPRCHTLRNEPEGILTRNFGDVELGSGFSDLSSREGVESGTVNENLDVDADVSRLAVALNWFYGWAGGTLIGIGASAVFFTNSAVGLCTAFASPVINAKMNEGKDLPGFPAMGDIA
ncbi:MAG: hypothetical protein JXA24_00640 [Proteobacteria bacterium]|nr:hypothetical protein [Pseudomonadota bacterium]